MLTTIQVKTETRDRLKSIGKKGESYDAIINRLLDTEARAPPPPLRMGSPRCYEDDILEQAEEAHIDLPAKKKRIGSAGS